ncbi:glycosyl transferase group 1 [Rhodomicrobium vannielii ATCC 17100]|uniref:Glycosyl transferase group 1 n=1 Tax=Rhodomicrobium vannielii (strain ATCC 17100 / DSM 162 / LMG 4299 / NCIMB 10020 / ATH 3.1.1) TaxID=648757 RepID=E3I5G8_RHOVT|nr:glycosyltransferase family 1 protein [Rhodomicrobium vannielii]ADP71689.1 glycosyl transferase group 1 [Rhodomicrobium vannielii ATCC 17100]
MTLFLDVTRISTRVIGSTPTGIDRVEYAYATEIFSRHRDLNPVPIITTPLFSGALRREVFEDVLDRVAKAWKLERTPRQDQVYLDLKAYLEQPIDCRRLQSFRVRGPTLKQRFRGQAIFPFRSLVRAPMRLARRIQRAAGQPNFYLNSSHTQLEQGNRFAWTKENDIGSLFFIHDIIPIDFPEFVSPKSRARHEGRLKTVSELGRTIIVNSDYTARSVAGYLESRGMRLPETKVIPLGVTEWFLGGRELLPPSPGIPYFVLVSTIEPRKNMLFLFAVWRKLAQELGPRTPRLVIVGHRGWENENVIDVLDRSSGLAPFLVEATDLSDAGLASLLSGAAALVSPSSVEGFGLPIAEALSLGVPAIVSSIPAHREVGGEQAFYIDPIDGMAWLKILTAFVNTNSAERSRALDMARNFKPFTLKEHVGIAADFARALTEQTIRSHCLH